MRAVTVVVCVLVASVAFAETKVKVPNLVGKTLDEANALMKAAGFVAEAEDHQIFCDNAPDVDDGYIRCQDPAPGTLFDKYHLVNVNVVRNGHKKGLIVASQIRPLIDKPIEQVKAALAKLGFVGSYEMKAVDNEHGYGRCEHGTVCGLEPHDNVDVHGTLTMFINMPAR
ncbi:MAG TPA: PASTA domain-containing protein [Kofleriaceae bacterium]|jgi:beta-lactam-binding protein with PASTA domain